MKTSIKRVGNMAFEATTESGHTIRMDSSPAFGGEDSGARPMEMLLAGMGGCTSIDVIHILEKARQKVESCEVQISAERADTDPKVFTHIHAHFILKGKNLNQNKVQRAITLSAEQYCSASIMLGKTATITHDFEIISA